MQVRIGVLLSSLTTKLYFAVRFAVVECQLGMQQESIGAAPDCTNPRTHHESLCRSSFTVTAVVTLPEYPIKYLQSLVAFYLTSHPAGEPHGRTLLRRLGSRVIPRITAAHCDDGVSTNRRDLNDSGTLVSNSFANTYMLGGRACKVVSLKSAKQCLLASAGFWGGW
jgi:hypothetical protein